MSTREAVLTFWVLDQPSCFTRECGAQTHEVLPILVVSPFDRLVRGKRKDTLERMLGCPVFFEELNFAVYGVQPRAGNGDLVVLEDREAEDPKCTIGGVRNVASKNAVQIDTRAAVDVTHRAA